MNEIKLDKIYVFIVFSKNIFPGFLYLVETLVKVWRYSKGVVQHYSPQEVVQHYSPQGEVQHYSPHWVVQNYSPGPQGVFNITHSKGWLFYNPAGIFMFVRYSSTFLGIVTPSHRL
jgi:hypothetical protein